MKTAIISFLFFFILTFISCTQPKVDATAIKKQVVMELKRSEQAWNEGSIENFLVSYLNSDSLRFASGGEVNYGWQPVLERYKSRYVDRAAMGLLTFSDVDVTVISVEAALVFGRYTLKRESDEPTGLFTLLFRKTPDGWRIVHDHTSSAN